MSNSFKELMGEIKSAYDEQELDIFVPTAGRKVKFRPLNLKQQKEIINKLTDLSHASLDFNIVVDQIIQDNLLEKDVTLYIVDKPAILLTLRSNYTNGIMKYKEDNETYEIDLMNHVKTFDNASMPTQDATIETPSGIVHMSIPTVISDKRYNKFLKSRVPRSNDQNDLYKIIGDMYVYEVVKFVKAFTLRPNTEDPRHIDMKDLTNEQRLEVVQAFDITTAEKMLDFVSYVRQYEDKFTESVVDGKKLNITLSSAIFATD